MDRAEPTASRPFVINGHDATREAWNDEIKGVLHECCSAFYLIAMREAAQGDLIEYSYQVRLIDPSYQPELVEKLHEVPDLTDANLLMQRTTVEL